MKFLFRIVTYFRRYRLRFYGALTASFCSALFNGLSLTSLLFIFGALFDSSQTYYTIPYSLKEQKIIKKILSGKDASSYSFDLLKEEALFSNHKRQKILSFSENLHLYGVIQWKLKINQLRLSPFQAIACTASFFFLLFSIRIFFQFISMRLYNYCSEQAIYKIRRDFHDRVVHLPLTWFHRNRSSDISSRVGNDCEWISFVFSEQIRHVVTAFFFLSFQLFLLSYLNFPLLILCILTVLFFLLPLSFFSKKLKLISGKALSLVAELQSHLHETLQGIRVIRLTGMENYETKKFERLTQKLLQKKLREVFFQKFIPYTSELNATMMMLSILILGSFFLDPNYFRGGDFITFFITLVLTIRPISQLTGAYAVFHQTGEAAKRVFEIMDHLQEQRYLSHPRKIQPLKKSISFENVCFTYPETEKQVLHNISLHVNIGSTIALVGKSGGGKSSMMDILAGFFAPTSGRVLLDGHNLQDFHIKEHRKRIGIVTQDIFLFYGSIYENIVCKSPQDSPKDAEKAARLAYAHDFITEFPDGYQTLVGNRGMSLSGGQRQRIAIARALLRDAEILILDEATSALDAHSERMVQKALQRLFQNRTVFVIAHHLKTIEQADKILVLDSGKIVEEGSHNELLKRNGSYSRLLREGISQIQ